MLSSGGALAVQLAAAMRRLPAEGLGRVNDIMQTDPAFPGSGGRMSLSQISDRVLHRMAAQIQTEQVNPHLTAGAGLSIGFGSSNCCCYSNLMPATPFCSRQEWAEHAERT